MVAISSCLAVLWRRVRNKDVDVRLEWECGPLQKVKTDMGNVEV
jgi:hypothetical protein